MKLVSVNRARSIWIGNLMDLNPRGHSLVKVVPAIVDKYRFMKFPIKLEELQAETGVTFKEGIFQNKEGHEIYLDLNIFNWGIVAETRSSTEDSDDFLDEFLTWIVGELDLVPYKEILKRKIYVSELWVQTDKTLNGLNPKLAKVANHLASLIVGHEHHRIEFEPSGILFSCNPETVGPPATFRFERAEGIPFNENRYYSAAPLQTDAHLEILRELEKILSS